MKKSALKKSTASMTPLVIKTVLITACLILGGAGLFLLGFRISKGNIFPAKRTTDTQNTRRTDSTIPDEVPYGDENLDTDEKYREAMRNVGQGIPYTSPFGYTLILPSGWHVVDRLTFDDKDGKREAFSPYSDEEVDQMLKNDPYNPNYYIEVEIRENPKNVSLSDWTTKSAYSPQAMGQQNFNTTLAGHPAVKVIGNQGDSYVDYYVNVGNKVYNLGYFYTESEQWKSPPQFSIKIFEDIISSFALKK
jgi:hypothetical protein